MDEKTVGQGPAPNMKPAIGRTGLPIRPPARSPRRTDSGRDGAGEVGKYGKERQKFDGPVQEQVADVPMVAGGQIGPDRFGVLVVEEDPDSRHSPREPSSPRVPVEVPRDHILGKQSPQPRLVNAS